MRAVLISIPIFLVLAVVQSVLVSRFELLQGTTDLLLLTLIVWSIQRRTQTAWQWGIIGGLINSLFSALPFGVVLVYYAASIAITLLIRRRVWQVPILAMFVAVIASTLVSHLAVYAALRLVGNPMPWFEALNLITLPSLLLNILFSIPAYALMGELAEWLYPEAIDL